MRICVLTNNLDNKNGGGRFSREFINSLKDYDSNIGIDILVTEKSDVVNSINLISSSKIKLISNFFKIRNILKKNDIIHAFDCFPYGVIATIASIGLNKKIIITAIGSGSIKPLYENWRPLLKWAYKRADVITAISDYTASEIKKKVKDLDIHVVIPGINYKNFADKQDDSGNKIKSDYILSVGRIKPRKGYEFSIKAFSEVLKKIPSLKYIIVGSGRGDYFDKINQLVETLGIKESVFFKENISDDELVSLYINAKLFILISQNVDFDVEGFGLVFVEAAAFGIPSIGSRNCGAESAILDGENGWLVDPKNIYEIAERIVQTLEDKELYNNFKIKSLEFAKSLDWTIVIKKYLKIYELLLKDTIQEKR